MQLCPKQIWSNGGVHPDDLGTARRRWAPARSQRARTLRPRMRPRVPMTHAPREFDELKPGASWAGPSLRGQGRPVNPNGVRAARRWHGLPVFLQLFLGPPPHQSPPTRRSGAPRETAHGFPARGASGGSATRWRRTTVGVPGLPDGPRRNQTTTVRPLGHAGLPALERDGLHRLRGRLARLALRP